MDFQTILSLILGNMSVILPLFLWNRSESREDARYLQIELNENRQETNTILRSIQEEIRNFHLRLDALEEKVKK